MEISITLERLIYNVDGLFERSTFVRRLSEILLRPACGAHHSSWAVMYKDEIVGFSYMHMDGLQH
jgi:hypothetical protein